MSAQPGDYTTLVPVTGEAVALDLRLAEIPSRMLALALDLVVQVAALMVVVWFSVAVATQTDSAAAAAISLVSVVAIIVGLPTLVETLSRGRSLGKLAAGLRVVRDDGGPVRFRHAFVRALFMLVDFWISSGAVGLISALASSRSKRLGDHFAGTVVIRERVPVASAVHQLAYAMPPALEGWAATLDLTRLPDVTVLQARQFLARAASIAPGVRTTIGQQLAAEVASYVTPPAPLGTPPETYLLTVLTERMRRASRAGTPPRTAALPAPAVPAAEASTWPGPPGTSSGVPGAGETPGGPFAPPR
ncbi:MAG: RDD family protein [Actinomycetales bacterium]|nr:RDD family protein [Actinomycetales bacterium]